jgi:SpoVK/Ycf46/Vps4 family AAA+-type ATPase
LLENIKVPTIWLSNSAHIDPAYLRRFSYVMELKHPDQMTKKKLLAKYHPTMKLRKAFIDELTAFPDLSIAAIRQAYTYAELSGLNRRAAETFIAHSVAGKHDANNWEKLTFKTLQTNKTAGEKFTHYPFNPAYVNINENLDAMVSGLKRTGEGRMVFFGPPGTGKTSLAHYLAKSIGKELIQKDAASLQSCWLGETEKLIHQAFEQAKKQKAILFLDEADSFLTSRATHARSWETSQVNQLLQEMEKFNGILIMSTNLIDRLDEAAARRFDYKIRFDYMNHAQRVTFFENWLQTQGTLDNYDSALYQTRLQSLDRIVPGYFQLLSRKVRISGETYDASQLFERLRMEMYLAHKELSRPIGFIQ